MESCGVKLGLADAVVHIAGDSRVDPGSLPANPPRIVGTTNRVGGRPPDARVDGSSGHKLSDAGKLKVVGNVRQPLWAIEMFGETGHVVHVVDGQHVGNIITRQAIV